MNKTPVSILQEMMVKKGTVPNYELIHDGGGTHVNTFTFQVTCDGLSATGTGRCKKDAKHEAAKAMLETIAKVRSYPQLPASPAQSPIRTPLPPQIPASPKTPANVPFINAIGALQELCAENDLQEPEYQAVSDVGPPHARVFTVLCLVSTFREEGIATTKKQAKHEAAKKMLDRIMDVVSDTKDCTQFLKLQTEETRRHEIVANEIAKARYPELTRLPLTKKSNLGVKLSEYHIRLRNSLAETARTDLTNRLDIMINRIKIDLEQNVDFLSNYEMIEEFQSVLTSLNIECKKVPITTENDESALVALQLDTSPEIFEISSGSTETDAEIKAMLRLMMTLKLLLN